MTILKSIALHLNLTFWGIVRCSNFLQNAIYYKKNPMFKMLKPMVSLETVKKFSTPGSLLWCHFPCFTFIYWKNTDRFVTDKLTYNDQALRRLADLRDEHFMNIKINGQMSKMNKINWFLSSCIDFLTTILFYNYQLHDI